MKRGYNISRPTGRRPPKQDRTTPDGRPADTGVAYLLATCVFLVSVTSVGRPIMST